MVEHYYTTDPEIVNSQPASTFVVKIKVKIGNRSCSIVVKHLPRHPMVEGLSPATTAGTEI